MKTLGPIGLEAFERRSINPETAARFAISIDELLSKFEFNAAGQPIWKSGRMKGRVAGTLDRFGYRRVCINGKQIQASHVSWAIEHGKWPVDELDHLNRSKDDNRPENLREVTRSENLRNRKYAKSGAKGVYWCSRASKWRAIVRENKSNLLLGYFETVEAASEAYLAYRGGEL